jgi:hypothetical protein
MMTDLSTWSFSRIALLVTGKGEEQFLPRLFRSLEAEGHCSFRVGRRIPRLRPRTSAKAKMVGARRKIDAIDERIGLAARAFLHGGYDYVVLVDDLDHDFRDQAEAVFQRYRTALDTILGPAGLSPRASVHFLVNMLEAYYFAHAKAINAVLGTNLADFEGDVETIRHPKNELKKLHQGFDESSTGERSSSISTRLMCSRIPRRASPSAPSSAGAQRPSAANSATSINWRTGAISR